jgi:hypothetical protein
MELKELDEFLPARTLEHDSPTPLFRPACERGGFDSDVQRSPAPAHAPRKLQATLVLRPRQGSC